MKPLGDLGKLFLAEAAGAYRTQLIPVLQQMGRMAVEEIKNEIGNYQSAIGPYPATAQLSPVTLDIKTRQGLGLNGNPDTPLWATGDFWADVSFQVDPGSLSVEIGTNKFYIVYTELGTGTMPPRPIFGPATLRIAPQLGAVAASGSFAGIFGGVWSGLGVRGTTATSRGQNAVVL